MFYTYRPLQKDEFIIAFADVAAGGDDYCAVQFLSQKWLDIPLVYHAQVTGSYMTPLIHQKMTEIGKQTGISPIVAFETNNGGNFEMDRLARLNRYGDYRIYTMKNLDPTGRLVDTGKYGFNTNMATRPKMLQDLKDAIEGRMLHLYHKQTVNEMFSFIIAPSGKPEAEKGAHDDLVMALAGVWQLYQTEQPMKEQGGGVVETDESRGMYKEAGVLYANDYNEYTQ